MIPEVTYIRIRSVSTQREIRSVEISTDIFSLRIIIAKQANFNKKIFRLKYT